MKFYTQFFDLFVLTIVATILSYTINRIFVRYGITLRKEEGTQSVVRWGSRQKSATGGISFFVVFLLFNIGYLCYSTKISTAWLSIDLATALGFFLGLYDDTYHLRPLPKFLGQLLCAGILIAGGLVVNVTHNLVIDGLITVFWVVGMMNSINMLDNMDGITGSISLIAIVGMFVPLFEMNGFTIESVVLLGVIGALAGFLRLNWNPSKLYMGDSGSQFLGAFLGGVAILCLWKQDHFQGQWSFSANLLLPILVFIVPLIDTTIVTFKRMSRGSSPFVGGKDHITHHFVFYALTDRSTGLLLASIACVSAIIYNLLYFNIIYWAWYIAASLVVYCVALFVTIFYFYQQGERKKKLLEHNQNINKTSDRIPKTKKTLIKK